MLNQTLATGAIPVHIRSSELGSNKISGAVELERAALHSFLLGRLSNASTRYRNERETVQTDTEHEHEAHEQSLATQLIQAPPPFAHLSRLQLWLMSHNCLISGT